MRPLGVAVLVVLLFLGVLIQLAAGDQVGAEQLLKQIAALLGVGVPSQDELALVKRVVDGDTIVVEIGGKEYACATLVLTLQKARRARNASAARPRASIVRW